jgi:hypothetical protein
MPENERSDTRRLVLPLIRLFFAETFKTAAMHPMRVCNEAKRTNRALRVPGAFLGILKREAVRNARVRRAMVKLSLDMRPRALKNGAVVRLVRLGPSISLLLTMLYFGIVYLLFYIAHVSHPLLTASLGIRTPFGFDPVRSSVVLHECAGVNSILSNCPANLSDYNLAVFLSYVSPLMRPKLSVTSVSMVVSMIDFLGRRSWGRFGALWATRGYDPM